MVEGEVLHVALYPPDTVDTEQVKKVAEVVHKEPYDTRLLMVGEMPRLIAHCHDMPVAESLARILGELGLVAFICRDSELRRHSQRFMARTMEFAEGEVVFRDRGGQVERVGSGDAFLIVKGKTETQTEAESTDMKMKVNWRATLLTGGIPIMRSVREKTGEESIETELFARVYNRKSSERCIEVIQHQVDYSFLGADMALSTLANFNTFVSKLQETFPQAAFNDRLMKPFKADIPSSGGQESIEINCNMLYLYHMAVSGAGPPG